MEPKRIFITGANGFVGRHLIAHLVETFGSRISIFAAVRPEEATNLASGPCSAGWTGRANEHVRIVAFDVLDAAQVKAAVASANPDQIIHLAARSSGADTDRDAIMAVNVEGTRNVLEAAAMLSPFPRALVVSTGYVYGSTDPGRPAREEDPIGPLWRYGPYTDSKIQMESVVRNYRAFALIARPFSHTGPGQARGFALPGFAYQLARIERGLDPPVLNVGNLSATRDLLDVRDVVRAYVCLMSAGEAGEAYNIATGVPIIIGDAVDQLRAMCNVPTRIEVDPTRLRPAEISCSSGDPLRTWSTTQWSPRISIDRTLEDTLNYMRLLTQ